MQARVLHPADYRRMRWKNGGGWTTELAAAPRQDAADGFDWRISIAEIESDGDFSPFPGCDRSIALLEGAGMQLDFDAAPSVRLEEYLRFFHFAGETKTRGLLLSGPVRDFNVMIRRNAVRAEILRRPLVGPMVFLRDPGVTWFVYLLGGQAAFRYRDRSLQLAAGESLLLQYSEHSANNIVLNGGGEVLIVKLARVDSMSNNASGDRDPTDQ